MSRIRRVALLVALLMALSGAQAHAYDFTVSPDPPNEDQVTTFRFQGSLEDVRRIAWDLDNDTSFDDGLGVEVSRTYASPGPVTARMRVTEDDGGQPQVVTKPLTVNAAPVVDFDFAPASPLAGQAVKFTSTASDAEADELSYEWDFDDGATAAVAAPTHAWADAGTYDVALTVTDEHGAFAEKTLPVAVAADPGPVADFEFSPFAPLTGDTVTFTSTSIPSQGSMTALDWDLDGDGELDDASGPTAAWSYSEAGTHLVSLRVEQSNGRRSEAFKSVEVGERPPPAPPPPADETDREAAPTLTPIPIIPTPSAGRLVRMRPFPVVRIAGIVLRNGADVSVLSIRLPRGALVRARCRGRGCPVRTLARTSRNRLVRLRQFERRLRAGITIEIFVRKGAMIGKYTRFRIRAGEPPARVDRCLVPGRRRPSPCS